MAIDQLPAKPGDAICQTHSDAHVVLACTVIYLASHDCSRKRYASYHIILSYRATLRSAAALLTRPAFAAPGAANAWEIVWIHKVRLPFRMLRRVCLRIGARIAGT